MKVRGELIPLVFEEILLGTNEYKKREYNIIVINTPKGKYGLVVDEFVGQLDVVQKPLTGSLSSHPFISGTSLLGNGDVLFVLNPLKITKI
jgi:two-component system chemotaxis sensor kinase CheA